MTDKLPEAVVSRLRDLKQYTEDNPDLAEGTLFKGDWFIAAGLADPDDLPPLVLAYLGDAVYELFVRVGLVARGFTRVGPLHQEAIKLVRATCQARVLHEIEETLTPEEIRVMKRGRNAKSGHVPRSTEVVEYRWSTGFESLIGYLYLKQRFERLEEILAHLPWPAPGSPVK